MQKVFLKENWRLEGNGFDLEATVPGCVHTDLLNNNLIPDPYWRDNNSSLQWIEQKDWTYSCNFDADISKNATLVFEGLDTYAAIYLNGVLLGEADNMFVPYEFDVTGMLKQKDNNLTLKFTSPIKYVEGMPLNDAAFTAERINTRRIQCTYGWDWVDRFVTCGIFRPVYLEYGDNLCVDNIYIFTENIDDFSAQMYLEINFKNYTDGGDVDICVISPQGEAVFEKQFYTAEESYICRFDIANPQLWYPNGYGEHPLYKIVIKTGLDQFCESFGVRTIKVLQLTDCEGSENYKKAKEFQSNEIGKVYDKNKTFSGFRVIVNNIPVFCQGANWVPCEPFPSAQTKEKYTTLLQMAEGMGLNMLRVWGGGYFENRFFYDECDRLGILVAQDFLMACATYPEKEEWFIEMLKRESRFAAIYLRNHPCLAWWHGDNENAIEGSDKQTDYKGRDSAVKGLEENVYKYDRSRQFFRSSPYGGDTYASITVGTSHNTNYIGDTFKYFESCDGSRYKEYLNQFGGRFISEEPIFGMPQLPTLLKFDDIEDVFSKDQEIIKYHTKTNPYFDKHIMDYILSFTEKVLGEFKDVNDRFFKCKYIQYEWMRIVFENARRNLGYCDGILYWMFDDCWPAALGWSIIDYYCLPKSSYYMFKRCAKSVTASVTERDGKYRLSVSNTAANGGRVELTARLLNNGKECLTHKAELEYNKYSALEYELPFEYCSDSLVICDINANGVYDRAFYKSGNLNICEAKDAVTAERNGNSVTVRASRYVHTVELEGSYLFSDNYFSLLEGESKTITFTSLEDNTDFTVTAYTLE